MAELKKAGSAQTRKTYARHGGSEPMFGVSFAKLKEMTKRIDVDHELALELWDTTNLDARNLAVKVVDPARMRPAELDRWARETWSTMRMCGGYVGMVAAEGPHGAKKAVQWLASGQVSVRGSGWTVVGQLAQRDEGIPDAFFERHISKIARTIHAAPNAERDVMNTTLIAIGGRSPALRKAALAAARKIGKVVVDYGNTSCKTPDAAQSIEKTWAYATSKGFPSPAAQERARETPRRRC